MSDDAASQSPDAAALRAWLDDHDDVCPACHYELRGLVSDACPECGIRLTLGVRAPGLRLGPWVGAMLALTLAVGFDGVAVLLMLWQMATAGVGGLPPEAARLLPALSILGTLCAAGIWALWRGRAWCFMRPRPVQIALAGALFVGTGLVHAVVGLWIVV